MSRRAVVVGGGIAGSAAALALSAAGWRVTALERRAEEEGRGAGSGISLWPNALRALDHLGVEHEVVGGARLAGASGVRAPSGRWLARTDLVDAIVARQGHPLILTRREQLLDVLRSRLEPGILRFGIDAVGVFDDERGAGVVTAGGETLVADLVVVADGARSRLRTAVVPDAPPLRYAGYTTWRMLADRPRDVEPFETWGRRGERFAVLPVGEDRVYCYATANAPEGAGAGEDQREELRRLFGGWHEPIPRIIASLGEGQTIRTDVFDLEKPLAVHHRGRLVLLGDAAHPMTPDLGQGGCQALEDAVTLGALLGAAARAADAETEVAEALARYSRLRVPRTAGLMRASRRAGRIYQVPPFLARAAARLSGVLPPRMVVRGLEATIGWAPPGV